MRRNHSRKILGSIEYFPVEACSVLFGRAGIGGMLSSASCLSLSRKSEFIKRGEEIVYRAIAGTAFSELPAPPSASAASFPCSASREEYCRSPLMGLGQQRTDSMKPIWSDGTEDG